jgi:hypothetical protein
LAAARCISSLGGSASSTKRDIVSLSDADTRINSAISIVGDVAGALVVVVDDVELVVVVVAAAVVDDDDVVVVVEAVVLGDAIVELALAFVDDADDDDDDGATAGVVEDAVDEAPRVTDCS